MLEFWILVQILGLVKDNLKEYNEPFELLGIAGKMAAITRDDKGMDAVYTREQLADGGPYVTMSVNEKNEVVICFDEGEVAPMHMGSVEFVIPSDLIKDIRVN